jgi:hypothetical protein
VFKLGAVERPRAIQGKQMPPRFWGEPTPLVRAQHAKSHITVLLTLHWSESKKGRCSMPGASILSLSDLFISIQPHPPLDASYPAGTVT